MARIELIDDDPPPRRPRAHATERSARNNVGGPMVAGMKRGMRKDDGSRVMLLAVLALVLLLALNYTWGARVLARLQQAGGWGKLVEGVVARLADGGRVRDEV